MVGSPHEIEFLAELGDDLFESGQVVFLVGTEEQRVTVCHRSTSNMRFNGEGSPER
jgi:hypothetical protein